MTKGDEMSSCGLTLIQRLTSNFRLKGGKVHNRVIRRVGPLNYEVVLEDTGEDLCIVNVVQLKLCFPTAEEVDRKQRQKILEVFQEESDGEDFPGFSTPNKKTRV